MCPLQPVKLRISPVSDARATSLQLFMSLAHHKFDVPCFYARKAGVGLVSCVAQLCDGRAESRAYAETFRRMPRSDHRNSLVRMGTHPRNDDQDTGN
jgi:hypothetical protein